MGLVGGAGEMSASTSVWDVLGHFLEMWHVKLFAQRLALGKCSGSAWEVLGKCLSGLGRPGGDEGKGFPGGRTNAGRQR